MMFGHTHAPRWWTKLMRNVVTYLRRCGIRCVIYIDDLILFHGTDPIKAAAENTFVRNLLLNLGLTINFSKSISVPCTRILFLGFLVDSLLMKLEAPASKVKDIVKNSRELRNKGFCTVRVLASLLGKINAVSEAILPWRLKTRSLLLSKNRVLATTRNWEAVVILSESALGELDFWTNSIQHFNGRDVKLKPPDWITVSDSSDLGFGGQCLTNNWCTAQECQRNCLGNTTTS